MPNIKRPAHARVVAIKLYRVECKDGKFKWACRCEWCNWRPDAVDTLAENIRLARAHVNKCERPSDWWTPDDSNDYAGWLLGFL